MTNAASERQIKASRERQKTDVANSELIIKSIMTTPGGRRWVWLQLEKCHIFSGDGSLEHANLAYSAGKRSIGLQLLSDVTRTVPMAYIKMTQENTGVKLEEEESDD